MFREFSVKDFSLTCTMDVAGKAFVLSSHFIAGSSPHSSAQHQFLPGILELFSLCQPVPVPPWDFTQEFVRMLLLFLPCPASSSASQKALPTSQIFPKAGIPRQYCSKCIFFFLPSCKSYPSSFLWDDTQLQPNLYLTAGKNVGDGISPGSSFTGGFQIKSWIF